MGYNFTIRPKSSLTKKDLKEMSTRHDDIEKHLNRIRKQIKKF